MSGAETVQLVVGLGNPGAGHAEDRHNVGFWLIDALASALKVDMRIESRYKGELGRAASGLRLLKPSTYMNLSGESVAPCAAYFRVPPASVLVVHDELDLPVGAVRLKRGGGHGGHNGLRSIEQMLGTNDYLRIRLGIGHPGVGRDVAGYVLSRPPAAERDAITAAINAVLDNFETITNGGFNRAMNTLNQRVAKVKE
ncbi:MAG: aminoacyl-tRNA hydrolase [Gammaproteobacteria bacterium]|nr:aminoacyl-tRNA hydrolase [Gammaproteobacteria bacterium]